MNKKASLLTLLALLFILAAAADLRLYHNAFVPGWYNDEGTLINIANNLNLGRVEYMGMQESLLLANRQPLFTWILAVLFRLFGSGMQTLRTFTGLTGVIGTALIFMALRKHGRLLALFCALAYALFPKAVLYSRFGFSYNLIALLALLAFWACLTYLDTGQRRYAAAAAVCVSLALLSEMAAVAFIPPLVLIILWKRWRDLFFALPLIFLPAALYSASMLITAPQTYLFDINFIYFRVSSLSLPLQLAAIVIGLWRTLQDMPFLLGIIGAFLQPATRLVKTLLLFMLLPFAVIARSIQIVDLGAYHLIPVFPFFAIGAGLLGYIVSKSMIRFSCALVEQILSHLKINPHTSAARYLLASSNAGVILVFIAGPLLYTTFTTHNQIQTNTYPTGMEWVSLNIPEAEQAANYINAHTVPDDLVLASPAIAWAIHSNTADYQTSIFHVQNQIPDTHFRYKDDYLHAKFIVVDNIWKNFAEYNTPDLVKVRRYAEQFPLVFKTDSISIYQAQKTPAVSQ